MTTDGSTSTVLAEDRGAVRILTLNRPERLNAITPRLVADLVAALTAAHGDEGVRAIVLTGAGRAFCAGDDLHDVDAQTASPEVVRAFVEDLQEVTRLMLLGPVPVVGAVRGWAVGGGLEWVLDCDVVVVGDSARGFFPEMRLGLFVTGAATLLLPRIVGAARARDLLLLGDRIDAARMVEWGIASRQVSDAEVLDVALEIAERIAALPERAVRDLRRALLSPAEVEAALATETAATVAGFTDPATADRIRAHAP